MRRPTITQKDYLKAAQLFHWAKKEHYQMWFTGNLNRHRRTEVMLPRLVQKKKLVAVRYGRSFVYTVPRRVRYKGEYRKVDHGLAVTEGLVRFCRSRMNVCVIEERYFYGLGAVAEFGLLYPNDKMLLYEYCSRDNFERTSRMIGKVVAYERNLEMILAKFNSKTGIVVFVIDISPGRILSFLKRLGRPEMPFYFVDYQAFKNVPTGEQLTAPIYIWGKDCERYPLSHD